MRRHARALGRFHVARAWLYAKAQRWPASARAAQAALRCDDDPRSYLHLGRALERLGRWEAAVDAYEAAVARNDRTARWHARLGRARARVQRWTAAAEAYEAAARLEDNPRWRVRAAQARRQEAAGRGHRRAQRRALAARRAQQADRLAAAGTVTELDRALLDLHPERLPVRREVTRMIGERIDEIRDAAQLGARAVPGARPRVYVFWAQGIANAPAVVRRCHDELQRLHAEDDVVVLDASNLGDYVSLPRELARRVGDDWTRLSDLLRLELLSSHGGVWMDATCLPRVRVLDRLDDLLRPSGFFAFAARHARLASWFLAGEPDNYLVAMMREAHYAYWRRHDRLVDYFLFHHIFEALYHVDERFRALWDATPRLARGPASAFRRAMLSEYDPARFDALLDGCFVHKLTYKFDENALDRDTMIARLVNAGVRPLQ